MEISGNDKKTICFMMPLESNIATKQFCCDQDGKWVLEKSYRAGKVFRGFEIKVEKLFDAYSVIKENQENPVFFIHGEFVPGTDLEGMLRRKRVSKKDREAPTIRDRMINLFCLDVDGYTGGNNIEEFLKNLPVEFQTASYFFQYSATYGLTSDSLKVHLFFWLETPAHNVDIKNWLRAYNEKKGWGNMLDDSVLTSTQPVYVQKRVCNGGEDPIKEFMGFVEKSGNLQWSPEKMVMMPNQTTMKKPKKGTGSLGNLAGLMGGNLMGGSFEEGDQTEDKEPKSVGNLENLPFVSTGSAVPFDLATATREIVKGKRFHDNVRGMALSFLNNGVAKSKALDMIQGIMLSVPDDEKEDERWVERYNDIERMVDTASEIVDTPDFGEVVSWIHETDIISVQAGFADKLIKFDPIDRVLLIEYISNKIGVGKRPINATMKIKEDELIQEMREQARIIESEKRAAKGIIELEVRNDNHGLTTQYVAETLANSTKSPQVFIVGQTLCTVECSQPKTVRQVMSKNSLGEDFPKMPIIRNITKPVGILRGIVEKDCVFMNPEGKSIICPDSILNAVPRRFDIEWKPISGVVEHPFVNLDWEVTQKNGYDEKTGLFSMLHNKLVIEPMEPKKAYEYITKEVFNEFPFDTPLDEACAVACMMSAIQRPIISSSNGMPGYAMVSPSPSSGKTTLVQLINHAVYNRQVAATSFSDNDEEMGKHLLSILREGHSTILFDNIPKDSSIKSDELAKAMTSSTYSRRRLGENETEEVPSNVLWLFTGNNIHFTGDFATRILPIRIVPNMERPEERKFEREDIGEWAENNRKKIISALISLVKHGESIPKDFSDTASRFKDWDKMVRLPLLDITGIDLLDIFKRNSFGDDETMAKANVLLTLKEEFKEEQFTTKDVMNKINGVFMETSEKDGGGNLQNMGSFNTNGCILKESLIDAFGEKAVLSMKMLGRKLLGMKDSVHCGLKISRMDKKRTVQWMVNTVTGDEEAGIKAGKNAETIFKGKNGKFLKRGVVSELLKKKFAGNEEIPEKWGE